jgi:phospholipase/carboxylesterase
MASPRGFLAAFLLLAAVFVGCGGSEGQARTTGGDTAPDDRVNTPTNEGGGSACRPGEYALRLGNGRAARLRITPGPSKKPKGLIVVFHGAGGSASEGLFVFRGAWSVPGLVLVAPAALGNTWSALHQEKDRDLETVNRALAQAWRRCRIDRRRVAVGGFSDGATHALSIGLQNGDVFRSVLALSPGGLPDVERRGKPRVFITHGTRDDVLPIGGSDAAVRTLRSSGYSVTYRRFGGGHQVTEEISRAAVRWYLRR